MTADAPQAKWLLFPNPNHADIYKMESSTALYITPPIALALKTHTEENCV